MSTSAATPFNIRVYTDGRNKNSKASLLSILVAIPTLFLYTGWFYIFAVMILLAWIKPIGWVVLALLLTVLLPAKPVLWPAFNLSWVFKTWRDYFNFSFLFEEHLDQNKHYILVEFPHGVFPLGPVVAQSVVLSMFPDLRIYGVAATSLYYVPFWRHFMAWIGCVPATRQNFKHYLKKGSVAVTVGGIAEMFMCHPDKEQVMLKDRKGFARIAVEEGVDGIVPVFYFGNSLALDFGPQSLSSLSRKYRTALGMLYGRWGLPLPRQVPLYMVTGKAVPVTKVAKSDPGFDAAVDEVHGKVVAALQDLYDRHKASYGWSARPLEIH